MGDNNASARRSRPQPDVPAPHEGEQPRLIRQGDRVDLRDHLPGNRGAFIRWYQDPEVAGLLRHDLKPLTRRRAASYFASIILPLANKGHCWAIHRHDNGQLIGTAAVTNINEKTRSCLFRILLGEKDVWGQGFGTEASRLVAAEVFDTLPIDRIQLEVFTHNPRARRAYERVGFREYDHYQETVQGTDTVIEIVAMELSREALAPNVPNEQPVPCD